MLVDKNDTNLSTTKTILLKDIENKYFVDEFVDIAWPVTTLIILLLFFLPMKKVLESLANNLGKAKEVTIGGVSWKTIDLEKAVTDLEILKSVIHTAYIDEDLNNGEIEFIVQKARNLPSYLDSVSKKSKEKVLIESINIACVDKKIDDEEYVLFRNIAKNFEVSRERIDELIIDICITRKITPPSQLENIFKIKMKDYQQRI